MGDSSKLFRVVFVLALVCIAGVVGAKVRRDWVERDRRYQAALNRRQAEANAEIKATMEDLQRAMPQPDEATQRRMAVLSAAAPGGPSAIEIMMDPQRVRTLPQPQRDAALQTMLYVVNNGALDEKVMAIDTLGQMGDARAIYRLCQLTNDADSLVRYRAGKALDALGYHR